MHNLLYQITAYISTSTRDFLLTRGQGAEPVQLTFHSVLRNLYAEPSRGASCQISVHLVTRFQKRRFYLRNQPIRNKNCLWRSYLLTDWDKINILYSGPAIYVSYQVSVHLAMRFQRRRFVEIDQSEIRIACDGHVCKRIGQK